MEQVILKDELVLKGMLGPLSIEEQIRYLRKTADQLQEEYRMANLDFVRMQELPKHECCGKPMHNLPDMLADTEGQIWTCLECGSWYKEQVGQLDPELLDEYKENVED